MRFATCCGIAGSWSAGSRIRARNGHKRQANEQIGKVGFGTDYGLRPSGPLSITLSGIDPDICLSRLNAVTQRSNDPGLGNFVSCRYCGLSHSPTFFPESAMVMLPASEVILIFP